MATRSVYFPLAEYPYVNEVPLSFPWAGSRLKNRQAVQEAFGERFPGQTLLELDAAPFLPEVPEVLKEASPLAQLCWQYGCKLRQDAEKADTLATAQAFVCTSIVPASPKDACNPARAAALYFGLAAAGKLEKYNFPELFALEVCTPPEERKPALLTPASTFDKYLLLSPEQLDLILHAEDAAPTLLELARAAKLPAKNDAEAITAARELVLEDYRAAQKHSYFRFYSGGKLSTKYLFPLKHPSTNFRVMARLTIAPNYSFGWQLRYSVPSYQNALQYLNSCGYKIQRKNQVSDLPPQAVLELARTTGDALSDPVVAAFLQFIRAHLQSKDCSRFRFPKHTPSESRKRVVDLSEHWDRLGLFSKFSATTERIFCTLATDSEIVRHFVGGQWLELYTVSSLQKLLARLHREWNAEVSLYSNVVFGTAPNGGATNELDAAFTVNGVFFWVEAKSSSHAVDYGKYTALCKKLKVPPEQMLLLNSDLTAPECEAVSYFWDYRVVNCADFVPTVEAMIRKQLDMPEGEAKT